MHSALCRTHGKGFADLLRDLGAATTPFNAFMAIQGLEMQKAGDARATFHLERAVYYYPLDKDAHVALGHKQGDGFWGTDEQIHRNYAGRLTWQATPRNKFNFSYEKDRRITPHRRASATVAPEATTYTPFYPNAIATIVVSKRRLPLTF